MEAVRATSQASPTWTEEERQYDVSGFQILPGWTKRRRAAATALCYRRVPFSDEAVNIAAERDQLGRDADARIDAATLNENPTRLFRLLTVGGLPSETSPALGCNMADGLT